MTVMFDGEKFGRDITRMFRQHLQDATRPILERLDALEKRQPERGEKGDRGNDGVVDIADVAVQVRSAVTDLLPSVLKSTMDSVGWPKDGAPGKDADPVDQKMVDDAVSRLVPIPKDGKDGIDGRDGADGRNVPTEEVENLVAFQVGLSLPALIKSAVEALPVPRDGRDGVDGRDADEGAIIARVQEILPAIVKTAVDAIPVPKDGADGRDAPIVNENELAARVQSAVETKVLDLVPIEVQKAVSQIPAPKDGQDGRDGADGKDADVDEVVDRVAKQLAPTIETISNNGHLMSKQFSAVKESIESIRTDREFIKSISDFVVAQIPVPKDGAPGKDADPATIQKMVEDAFARMPKPKDGVGLAGATQNKNGELTIVLTDGTTRDVGMVAGRDGVDGKDYDPEKMVAAVEKAVVEAVSKIPVPKDGKDGRDGIDGLGMDDMDEVLEDDGRTLVRTYSNGQKTKVFRHKFSVVLDRGVWVAGKAYQRGDSVSYDGSTFTAQADTTAQPGTSTDWRLSAKRGREGKPGRNGKDGKMGPEGKPGVPGRPGQDAQ